MKLGNHILLLRKNENVKTAFRATLVALLALTRTTTAQEVLMSRPTVVVAPPALQEQTNEMEVFSPSATAAGFQQETQPLRWGPVTFRPSLFYRFLYGNGIQASTNQSLTTAIHEIGPEFLFEIGRNWTLNYTPVWRLYSNDQFRNTLDHSVRLTGGTVYEDWVLGLSQSYVSSSTPLVETGTQTEQETYSTALNASYRMNSKMSLDLAFSQNFVFAQQFESSREWSTLEWLNYQFWPRLDAGVGSGFGYVKVDTGSDMTYEQFQGRVAWRATDKVSFQVHGGVEVRQFLSGGASDLVNPVAGAVIQYQPFEATKFLLSAERVVAASYFQNQVTESTSVSGDLNQRLFKKLYLDLGGGYNTVKYVASSGVPAGRKDEYYSFNARLSCQFLKRGTFATFYQLSDNSSTQQGYGFSSTQFGLEVGFRY
jgi:hypothetical protein